MHQSRKLRFRRYGWLICSLVLGVCLAGCGQEKKSVDAAAADGNMKAGGALYFGLEVPFQGFDIIETGALNPPLAPLNNLILEPLFRRDQEGKPIPVLGLSASVTADGKAWDIKLRQGVAFHDGAPFNADAVIHHWSRILDPEKFRGRRILRPVRSVEKVAEYMVRFNLEHPWPPFMSVISNELLLLAFIPSPRAVEAGTHDRQPVGTGPFKFAKWQSSDHFVVFKNENYWQAGKPRFNKVVFRTIPDPQARYASLVSGEIDVVALDRGNLIQKAKADPELTVYPSQVNGAEIILINTTRPPLDDIRVRRALALANSQEHHVKMVYGNTVPLVQHPFGNEWDCADVAYPEYDLRQARQLLADYGKPVEIELLHSNTSRGRSIGELQQQLFKEIGVVLKPVGLSPGPQMMKVVQKDYQLATWRIPPSGDYGPNFYAKYHSRSPGNFAGYDNPEMDRLLEMQRLETDPEKRRAVLCRIARQLNRDVPILYRGGRRYHVITKKNIRDMMDSPGFTIDLAAAWLDETVNFNMAAYAIEQNVAFTEFECADPGDVDAVKSRILGTWKGKDSWGAVISMNFKADDTVDLHRTGGPGKTVTYTVCAPKVYFQNRASIEVTPVDGRLEGVWTFGDHKGEMVLERDG